MSYLIWRDIACHASGVLRQYYATHSIVLPEMFPESIVYVLTKCEKAFQRCLKGADVMLIAYEHDFRDRADVIWQRWREFLSRLSRKYAEVSWFYRNSLEVFQCAPLRQADTDPDLAVLHFGVEIAP